MLIGRTPELPLRHDCVPVKATDPFTFLPSGTTGQPKGVVRDNGGRRGYFEVEHEEYLWRGIRRNILGRVGCRMGSGTLLYCVRTLLAGNATVLYEGKPVGTPDPERFGASSASMA